MKPETNTHDFSIRRATVDDVPLILAFIKELAVYERLSNQVVATEECLRKTLFGADVRAEVVLGCYKSKAVGFSLFFYNYSTFLGQPGIYLEDIFVKQEMRGRGFGKKILKYIAQIAEEHNCGRLEWSVLDWNKPAINFYQSLGAVPMKGWTTFRVTGDALDKLADLEIEK